MYSADFSGACLFTTALLQMLEGLWCTSLIGPDRYYIFSEDLVLRYNISVEDSEELISAVTKIHRHPSNQTILHQELTSPIKSVGNISFQCGTITEPGKVYVLIAAIARAKEKMRSIKVISAVIEVQWPLFQLTVPMQAQTFSSNFSIEIELVHQLCFPIHQNASRYLQLRYAKRYQSTPRYPNQTQFIRSVEHLFTAAKHHYVIPCKLFDQEALYRFSLEANFDGWRSIIVNSSEVLVTLNKEYSLSIGSQIALPCKDPGVVVFFQYPQCILPYDRIRLFGRHRPQAHLNAPVHTVYGYISETRVIKGQNVAVFPCKDFLNASSMEYCFKYVSVASLGAVSELLTTCLTTSAITDSASNIAWSQWSMWSPCTLTCGSNGVRIRHRFCESHVHHNEVMHCDGEAVQSQRCEYLQCEDQEQKSTFIDTIAMKTWCRCGCAANVTSVSLEVASSGHHCSGTSTWIFKAPKGATIRVQFIYLDINSTFEWIKIRNGKQPNSDLLEQYSSGKRLDMLQSTSNEVVLQFYTLMDEGIGDGFIVQITALMSQLVSSQQELLLAMKERKLTANSVHTLGLAIFGALFCTAALCAVLQWLNWSKLAYFNRKKIPVYHGSIQEFQLMERATLLSYVSDTTESSELWEPLIQDTKVQLRSHNSKDYMNKRDAFSMLSPPLKEDHEESASEECTGEEISGKVRFKKEANDETTSSQFSQKIMPKIAHSNQPSKSADKKQLGKQLPVATVSPQPARALIKKNKQKELLEIENTEFTEKYSLNDNFKRKNEICRGSGSEESSFVNLKTSDSTISKKENFENPNKKVSSNEIFVSKGVDECSVPTLPDHTSQIVSCKRSPEQENSELEDEKVKQEKTGSSQEINSSALEIENDFEYDYYDYNVHYDPGSVFSRESEIVSWLPPFIPRLSSRSQVHELDEISNSLSKDT